MKKKKKPMAMRSARLSLSLCVCITPLSFRSPLTMCSTSMAPGLAWEDGSPGKVGMIGV